MSSDRATCWSITINNPVLEDYSLPLPSGWKLEGQLEKGQEGTDHYQGMLSTPQTRFPAVKKVFPRAHIEIARNKQALKSYVHKEETRVADVSVNVGLTVFQLQSEVCAKWDDDAYQDYYKMYKYDHNEAHLKYADAIVRQLMEAGMAGGIEFVAINPMWRSSWKLFGPSIVKRYVRE